VNRTTRRTVAALDAHREAMRAEGWDIEKGPVFVNRTGGWLSQPTLYRRVWTPALKQAGLEGFSPYSLRHTSATLLLQQGGNLKLVSERLGHENVEMTLRHYAHVLPADQDRAVGILDRLFGGVSPQIVPNWATLERSPETKKAATP
jgi:integrase